MEPIIVSARDVRPGDIVEPDCGNEAHRITEIEEAPTGELILHADGPDDEDLSVTVNPDSRLLLHDQLLLPGMPTATAPVPPQASKPRRARAPKPKVRDTSNFQGNAVRQGRMFDEQCRILIDHAGFECTALPFAVDELGIEIDAEIKGPHGGLLWCEFKGSWLGNRPGASRTDTAKKAITSAFLAWADDENDWPPVVLLTSHLPKGGSRGEKMLNLALKAGALHGVINVYEAGAEDRLRALEPVGA